jgi:hypothetical protein
MQAMAALREAHTYNVIGSQWYAANVVKAYDAQSMTIEVAVNPSKAGHTGVSNGTVQFNMASVMGASGSYKPIMSKTAW